MTIPNVCHFSYFRGPTMWKWRDVHTVALITAHEFGKFEKLVVHEDTPGEGTWYEYARQLPYVEWRRTTFPTHINEHPVKDQRILADLHRLQVLITEGGFYADLDFVFLAPMTDLLKHDAVIGVQNQQKKKLNCAMLGSAPAHDFFIHYLDAYDSWTPTDEKKFWSFANTVPWRLSEEIPITVLPTQAFYPVAWSNESFFNGIPHNLSNAYACHLWETLHPALTADKLLKTSVAPQVKHALEVVDSMIASKSKILTFE